MTKFWLKSKPVLFNSFGDQKSEMDVTWIKSAVCRVAFLVVCRDRGNISSVFLGASTV